MKNGRHWKSIPPLLGLLVATTILLLACLATSEAQEGVPAANVVCQHVGRIYLNPSTGKAVWADYAVHSDRTTVHSSAARQARPQFTSLSARMSSR